MISVMFLLSAIQFNVEAAEPAIMNNVRQNYNKKNTIRFQFDLSIFWSVREKTEKKTGTVILASDNRFNVSIGDELHISNGDKYWHYIRKVSQVTIEKVNRIDVSILPSGILQQFLSKNKFIQKSVSGPITELSMVRDSTASSPFKSIRLWVDQKGVISRLQTTDKNDNINTYTFHKTIFNSRVAGGTFEFNFPKNIQVLNNYE